MRRRIAFVLAIIMLNYNVTILADTSQTNSDMSKEGSVMSMESDVTEETVDNVMMDSEISEETPSEESIEESSPIPEEEQTKGDTTLNEKEPTEEKESIESSVAEQETKGSTELSIEEELKEGTELSTEEQEIKEKIIPSWEETPKKSAEKKEPYGENPELGVDIVYNVQFPASTRVLLDPGNLTGRGQIFSDRYSVENYGNTDVAIKIKNIEIYCEIEETYESIEDEIIRETPRLENLKVDMVWENENGANNKVLHIAEETHDECVIWLKASNYDANGELESLNKESTGYFYFTGMLDSDPRLDWESTEIEMVFNYEIINGDDGESKQDKLLEEMDHEKGETETSTSPTEEGNSSAVYENTTGVKELEEETKEEEIEADSVQLKEENQLEDDDTEKSQETENEEELSSD